MKVLGISAFYHDSAAALVVDGEIIAAAQEERFTRKKHDDSFPRKAIDYVLAEADLKPADLDYVAFYDKPLQKFDRLLETYVRFAPAGFANFRKAMPLWLRQKLHLPREMKKGLPGFKKRFIFPEHHESHAASAFYPSPFDSAAILTLDGVGEWATTTVGLGEGHRVDILREQHFPHSLGLLYSAFTYYCGFRVNSGEYKLMGLAPYGEPKFKDLILSELVDLKDDGSFLLNQRYFNYCQGLTMTNRRFAKLFGARRRRPESRLREHTMDVAASIQAVTEDIFLRCAKFAREVTGKDDLCLAGGVALNCVANGRLERTGMFRRIWIQPAAGDAGGALGAALFTHYHLLENPREGTWPDGQKNTLLGPSFSTVEVRKFLEEEEAPYKVIKNEASMCAAVAELLADEKVVGWFHGKMEFGPRALGSRSILADPRSTEMQRNLNLKIKFRESFRPFAPIVLLEEAADWFSMPENTDSPYMLKVHPVHPEKRRTQVIGEAPAEPATGLDKLAEVTGEIPAVTHVDGSARIQTVDRRRLPKLHLLLQTFFNMTGCPVLVNTSFNIRGEPIVCTPAEAYRCFMATDMDVLVLEDCLLLKSEQPAADSDQGRKYKQKYPID